MRETEEREVVLPDCAPEALEAVLRFCYMGECRLPRRDMLGLLVLADRLDIPDLTTLAEKVRPVTTQTKGAGLNLGCLPSVTLPPKIAEKVCLWLYIQRYEVKPSLFTFINLSPKIAGKVRPAIV